MARDVLLTLHLVLIHQNQKVERVQPEEVVPVEILLFLTKKLSSKAEVLEMAGKQRDVSFVSKNYDEFMKNYHVYKDVLGKLYAEEKDEKEVEEKPLADQFLMESVYEAIAEAADNMDSDSIEEALSELDDYEIPDDDKEKISEIKRLASKYDYESIVKMLATL
jgi:hypothetical protein